ncbi:hypothetical protein LOTGIDRAFT_236389 [Lottia gigantea]|uniref:HTH OST-type domain-containing protein n=1 Tax=Lottia gigantea TaxID=225164 RepID=V3Z0B0_LOTGI|nr:hypothetical protein LOTGIDRAFT_236389 [Lottia gigantea]ESO83883.1 hypothetical protein LOTGIDRAFT_236389 [Lottia gigantea]
MSSVAVIKEEAEKQIRALLNSTPAGLAVGELKRDYQQFIGSQIPYQKFGYSSAEDYFNDIPDVITPVWENGKTILKATANETTRHIEKLVSRQRVTNKSKWAALRKQSHGYASRPRYVTTPQVPVSIRHQIKQMFRQNRSLPLTHFDNLFFKTFGHHLDHERFGYSSVEYLLKSIPDTVTLINQHGEWRVLSAYARYQSSRRYQNDKPKPSSTPTKTNNSETTGIGITFASREPDNQEVQGSLSSLSSPTKSIDVVACSPPASPIHSSPEPEEFEDPVHKELKKVLSSHSKGIMASRLAFEYKAIIGKELPFKDHGYHSVIEFVNDIPNVVRIERPNPSGDFILFDATAPVSPSEVKRKISYANDRIVSDEIKEAIKQVLQTNPDGITMANFPSAFYDLTGKQIDPAAMGFSSFESLLLSLTDNVLQATYKGKECVVLNARDTNEPRRYDHLLEKYHPHAEPVPPHLESLHKKCSIPEDSILPGTYYTAQKLPEVTSDYIEVFVSNIVSPGLFWLQLRGKRTSEALENLMDDLAEYYMTSDSKRYLMPEYLYMIGQLCAVIFPEDNNWHRGIITGIRSMEVIEVYFVDYGNTCAVPKNTLRLLRSRFRKLPAQAIQARLANVKPIKEVWCVGARDRLLQICTNKPLVGFLTAVRDRVLSLCLTDTSQEEDIHLNDLLVEECYAKFAPDELHPSTIGPTQFAEALFCWVVLCFDFVRKVPNDVKVKDRDFSILNEGDKYLFNISEINSTTGD